MIDSISRFFVKPDVAYGLAIFIVAVGLTVIVLFWRSLTPLRNELRSATRRLTQVHGAEEFYRDFDGISEEFRGLRFLGHAWREFEESLVLPGARKDTTRVLNSEQAADAFTLEKLLEGRVNLHLYEAIPNLLVGVGLLFTFIALASGIHLAVAGLTSQDKDSMMEGLHSLLGGAFLAFLKSACGILFSIALIVFEKHRIHTTRELLERFCRALDERLELETHEKLAGLQLEELHQQTSQLKLFNDGLAGALNQAFETQVTNGLAPVLERLIVAVNQLRADRGDSNEEFLKSMLQDFQRSMSQATGGEFAQMASTVTQLRDVLEQSAGSMTSGQRQFEAASQRIAESLNETLRTSREGAKEELAQLSKLINTSLSESATKLGSELEAGGRALVGHVGAQTQHLTANVGRLEALTSQWSMLIERSGAFADKAAEASRAYEQSLGALRGMAGDIATAGQVLRSASERLTAMVATQGQATARIEGASADVVKSLAASEGAWKSYQERFEGVDRSLATAFQELDRGLSRYSEKVAEYVQSVEAHMSRATVGLSEAVSTLGDDLESLPEEVQKLGAHVEGLRLALSGATRS